LADDPKEATEDQPAKTIDVERLTIENPTVDAEEYQRASALLEKLRERGLGRPRYNLALPFGRRPGPRVSGARRGASGDPSGK
jgi:hypothetical protein